MTSKNDQDRSGEVDAASRSGDEAAPPSAKSTGVAQKEIGGPKGPDPTRFGDWERNGRCIDF